MEQLHEIIDFDNTVPIKCFLHKLGFSKRHWHESLELLFILSGSVDLILEDQVYTMNEEDILVINSNEIHELHAQDCILIALQIKPSVFEGEIVNMNDLYFDCNSCIGNDKEGFDQIRTIIARMVKTNTTKQNNYQLLNKSLAYQLMFILLSQFQSASSNLKNTRSHKNMERVSQIVDIIDKNYTSEITLASLADQVHLSVPYLSRFFDKQLGTTFLMYLNTVRLSHAVNDLLSTDLSIEQIALNNGFSGAHSFVQIFKKNYKCLPSVYRRNHQTQNQTQSLLSNSKKFTSYIDLEQYDYMGGLKKFLEDRSFSIDHFKASQEKHVSITPAMQPLPLNHTWKTFLTVGSAKQILYQNVQDMLKEIQSTIGYRYIKFHGILSDEMHVFNRIGQSEYYYSFAFIDQVLDFLLSIDLKPLIQLSFMPRELAADPQKTCFGYITSPPSDMNEWCQLIHAFTTHLIERYGENKVISWPFCVWNEPDTNYNMFGFSSNEEFCNFYKTTYNEVKNCHPGIQFGTPSNYYLTQYKEHWIVSFTEWCKENRCMPDFLNMHFYGTSFSAPLLEAFAAPEFNNKICLSEDENIFHSFIQQIKHYSSKLASHRTPVYLTEWNASPSHSDLLNDTCFVSCYIVKNILENYDALDSFAFWTLTDFLEESPIQPQMFQGGLGMITYNGVKKASYYAFQFLNKLGNELIAQDDGWFLTRTGDTYQLLLYNYKHYSSLYAQGEMFDMTPTNRYATFAPEEQLEFAITIHDISHVNYSVTESTINRHCGSSFDKWLEMGGEELTSKEEIKTLQNLSVPMINKYQLSADENELEICTVLEQLEVKLIILAPLK